jgi:ceramide glucosyltransferase
MTLLALPAICAAAYYLIALTAGLVRLRKPKLPKHHTPPVSILKPIRGRDPRFYEAVRSHAVQQYPEFEILFGVADLADPAVRDIERLQHEYPRVPIRLVHCTTKAPNGKVGVLTDLARAARYPVLLVNDSDIVVGPEYLLEVVALLADPGVGLVTCLYRPGAGSWPARFEGLGISTEFAPSVLVAPLVGVSGFALGSTMALRAADLDRAGGFPKLAEYLADDYHLGRMISELGPRVHLSHTVVETNLSGDTWGDVWRHQLRWSRTIRMSRTAGYYGYLTTQATFWSLVALTAGQPWVAIAAFTLRMAAGIVVGRFVLGDRNVLTYAPLIPLRDLWGFAIWLCGLTGDSVEWRGLRIKLTSDGRIKN